MKLQFALGVYVPYILKLVVRKFLKSKQRQISFLSSATTMSEIAVLWLEFSTVLWLFQENAEVESEFYFVLEALEDCSIVT